MNRTMRLTGLVALFLFVVGMIPVLAKTGAVPPPDYFPLRVGDWWKYRWTANGKSGDFQLKVEKLDGDKLLVETTMPTQKFDEWYSKPVGWVNWHKELYPSNNMTVDFDPVRNYLQNPLVVGGSWSWKGKGMMGVDIEENSKVSAADSVTVPAGKFAAMRVDTDVTQGGSQVKKSYWYANWIGMVKSTTSSGGIDSTTELVDYSFKKK